MTLMESDAAGRFSLPRVTAAAGRVMAARWRSLALVVLAFGLAPTLLISIPWVSVSPGPGAVAIVMAVRLTKFLLQMAAFAVAAVLLTTISLYALAEAGGRKTEWRPWPWRACIVSFVLSFVLNWPTYAIEIVRWAGIGWLILGLTLATIANLILYACLWNLALPAAVAEGRGALGAMGRSRALLRGLRWPSLAFFAIYYFAEFAARSLTLMVLTSILDVRELGGAGYAPAALGVVAAAIAAPFQVTWAAFYVQARRIADGPTEAEITEIFA